MEYYCDNFKKAVKAAEKLSPEKQLQVIDDNPKARLSLCALMLMFNSYNARKINIDDWECDLANQLLKRK